MLGYDVTYNVELNDNELLELAKQEKRVLLTRDLELYQRAVSRDIEAFYVSGKSEAERLAELARRYGVTLEIDMEKSHCPVCNTPLKTTPKEQLSGQLEKNTSIHYNKFWKCPNCGQIYWQGAHWKQISGTLKAAKEKLEESKKEN